MKKANYKPKTKAQKGAALPMEKVPPGVRIHVSRLPNGKIRVALLDFKHRCMLDHVDKLPVLHFVSRKESVRNMSTMINEFRWDLHEAGVF